MNPAEQLARSLARADAAAARDRQRAQRDREARARREQLEAGGQLALDLSPRGITPEQAGVFD